MNWLSIHLYYLVTYGAFRLLEVLGGCKIEQFTKILITRSLIDFISGGFDCFERIKLSSPNDSLGCSEVYHPHQRLFMFAFLFILPTKWLMWIFG